MRPKQPLRCPAWVGLAALAEFLFVASTALTCEARRREVGLRRVSRAWCAPRVVRATVERLEKAWRVGQALVLRSKSDV